MDTGKSDKPNSLGQESKGNGYNLPGYPDYPVSEDIYNICEEEKDIDPEDIFQKKESVGKYTPKRNSEKDLDSEFPGDDLDIPGSELDDLQEDIGSEDEENNYYSLGGDNHENLEEDQGNEQDLWPIR